MCLRRPGSQPLELALPDVLAQNDSSLCQVPQPLQSPQGLFSVDMMLFWKLKPFQAIPAMLSVIIH